MNGICIFFCALFILMGAAFACGKGPMYLSVWNSIPQQQRAKMKIKPLRRNAGAMIALSGLIFGGKGVCSDLDDHWFVWAMILWLIAAGVDAWYLSKSGRYQTQSSATRF
ncbi:MAG: DUF3784 domain-containing protein [Clostridiales bacterium]|nr:DUF3784 domain-containing protein [Clostridiales bacterium]